MMPQWVAPILIALVADASPVTADGATDDPESFFELKVYPVLAATCLKWHGAVKASSGLRLDSRAAMLSVGESGPAVLPGEPDKSPLMQTIRHKDKSPSSWLPKTHITGSRSGMPIFWQHTTKAFG
jgi:Planctomycete cytochrome C